MIIYLHSLHKHFHTSYTDAHLYISDVCATVHVYLTLNYTYPCTMNEEEVYPVFSWVQRMIL